MVEAHDFETDRVIGEVAAWEAAGERVWSGGHQIWCARFPATGRANAAANPPLLVLHGFPTCSFDWRLVLPALRATREVVLVDMLGFGLSDKPDVRYGLRISADGVEAVAGALGLTEVDLVTHDMGDSVGGELLARSLEGTLGFTVRRRVITNGSIYLDMAQLTAGQDMLMSLPDAREELVESDGGVAFRGGFAGTFAPASIVDDLELDCVVALARRDGGLAMLPRTIRYLDDRRAEEARFTGALETHSSPVGVVWGALDPVAVHAMAEKFVRTRTDAPLITLEGVGHYPMLEAPDRFSDAVLELLDS